MGSQQTVVHGVHVGDEKIVFLHSNGKLSPTGVCACRVHVAENCVHVVWGFCACRGKRQKGNVHPEIAVLIEQPVQQKSVVTDFIDRRT
jgi:hypothetical protein